MPPLLPALTGGLIACSLIFPVWRKLRRMRQRQRLMASGLGTELFARQVPLYNGQPETLKTRLQETIPVYP